MSPIDWATRPLKKYADFSGRASRSEYWWYVLLLVVAVIVAMIVESAASLTPMFLLYGPLTLLILVGTFVPTLAVQVRRLHDTNRSGLWLLLFYVPYAVYAYLAAKSMSAIAAGEAGMGSMAAIGMVGFVVLIFGILLLVFYVLKGTSGENRYGPDPLAGEAVASV